MGKVENILRICQQTSPAGELYTHKILFPRRFSVKVKRALRPNCSSFYYCSKAEAEREVGVKLLRHLVESQESSKKSTRVFLWCKCCIDPPRRLMRCGIHCSIEPSSSVDCLFFLLFFTRCLLRLHANVRKEWQWERVYCWKESCLGKERA